MKELITLLIFIFCIVVLIRSCEDSSSPNAKARSRIIQDIGEAAREIKEDFDKGFNQKKDSVVVDSVKVDSTELRFPRFPQSSQPSKP